ncbi:molybdate ABC transporter permease subunit [Paenalcaligenes hominis]|uniref:molybdate ABC transporter permease subunit n=1 Tax=Paenalcaligenes hominis TaxID=643674 RepID=UPI0035261F1B
MHLDCSFSSLWLSIEVLFWSLLWQCIIGTALAWLLARKDFWGKGALDGVVTLPLIFPPIVIGYGLLLTWGQNGWLSTLLPELLRPALIFTTKGLIVAAFIAGLPLMVKPLQTAFSNVPRRLHEAAATLGYSKWRIFLFVDLPLIRKGLAAGLILAGGRALGEVGISLMLGGNIAGRTETLSLAIFNHVMDANFACANTLSLLLAAFAGLSFYVLRRFGAL